MAGPFRTPPPVDPAAPAAGEKFRFRFAKTGALRLISHHDLARCFERMLRRSDLPFRSSQGFHPMPRVVFAQSLSVGVEALDEVVEVELQSEHEAADVLARLRRQAPEGLDLFRVCVVAMKASAVPRRMVYTLPIPAGRVAGVRDLAAGLLAQEKVWAGRTHPQPRLVNIRPFLRDLTADGSGLAADIWVTGFGTARADELVALLGLGDQVEAGAVLTRAALEIHDEHVPDGSSDAPPQGAAETLPWDRPSHPAKPEGAGAGDETDAARSATWGPSPHGPAVE